MSISTVSCRDFNQNASKIKNATVDGPVFITDRGQPAHVLMTIALYQQLTQQQDSIVDLLAIAELAEVDDSVFRVAGELYRPADLG